MRIKKFSEKRSINRPRSIIVSIGFLFAFLLNISANGEDVDGRQAFKKGKDEFSSGHYETAVGDLLTAAKEFPILGDYALYYLSEIYHAQENHAKSLETIINLKEKYPESPLVKRARLSEIRETEEVPGADCLHLYEIYLRDYPSEDDIAMKYGHLLRKKGENAKASAVFKDIYVKAGSFSTKALEELKKGDIKSEDLIERASNLMKMSEFRSAEQEFKKALSSDDGKHKEEILRGIGYSLFRQKEYKEAALIYARVSDLYFKARSLYRAGDEKGFEAALNELLKTNDRRAGELLIAEAAEKRREKDFEGALKIYREVLGRFPSETEDALWGMGWTYYNSGEYKKSSEIYSKMYSKYGDPKYLYWQARCLDSAGENAKDLYNSLMKSGNNFYNVLAFARGKIKNVSLTDSEPLPNLSTYRNQHVERVDILLSLGMTSEAVAELGCLSSKVDNISGLYYLVSKFYELGEFKRSISIATKIPYSENMHRFWYPLAYWEEVEKISKKYEIDPVIVLSVMREESRFDVNARSAAGARGLMQMMPQTAFLLDKNLKLGIKKESQIHDSLNSIHLGAYYLKSLSDEFKSLPHVLAAYNAGEAAVRKWEQQLGNSRPADEFIEEIPYPETRNYVKKVISSYYQYKKSFPAGKDSTDFGVIMGKL